MEFSKNSKLYDYLIDVENHMTKSPYNKLSKLGTEGNFPNLIKCIDKKHS